MTNTQRMRIPACVASDCLHTRCFAEVVCIVKKKLASHDAASRYSERQIEQLRLFVLKYSFA